MPANLIVHPTERIKGKIRVPGDKSISHRAVMLGAIACGLTQIKNFLEADDCLRTVEAFIQMDVCIQRDKRDVWSVYGAGPDGLVEPRCVIDAGNSGTTMRLLLGILAGQPFSATITGDDSLRRRPMRRVVEPLSRMGAQFYGRENANFAPIQVVGGQLHGIEYTLPVASAQVKSAILLAGLFAKGETVVHQNKPSRDHTERLLKYFGAQVQEDGLTVAVEGEQTLEGRNVYVPGDISSAAFFMVAAAIAKEGELLIENVGLNPTRCGILDVFEQVGVDYEIIGQREVNFEPMGDVLVRSGANLKPFKVGGELIPRLIDEIPVLCVLAACIPGKSEIRDASELRVKESDRIVSIAKNLSNMGVKVEELPDGMIIEGGRKLEGAVVESFSDHRIAMAFAIAGLVAKGKTLVKDADCVRISFPEFPELLEKIGVQVEEG